MNYINPKFRHLTDLLFYSNRTDLGVSDFRDVLSSDASNRKYFLDQFEKGRHIFWENGADLWYFRLSLIYKIDKRLKRNIITRIEKNMAALLANKKSRKIDPEKDLDLQIYIQHCKVKKDNGEDMSLIRSYLMNLPSQVKKEYVIHVIQCFIPVIFKSMRDYSDIVVHNVTKSFWNFGVLKELEKNGFYVDKARLARIAIDIYLRRARNNYNIQVFFNLLEDKEVLELVKKGYKPEHYSQFIDLIRNSGYIIFSNHNYSFDNIRNLIDIDPTITDTITKIYIDNLYTRYPKHNRANADRIVKLIKTIPEVSEKTVLAYLSSLNKMADLTHILQEFPELKKLSAFI